MAKFLEWLEGKNTRLRLFAGAISILLWSLLVISFLASWWFGKDLNANGGLSLFYAVGAFVASILGLHMSTKPSEVK